MAKLVLVVLETCIVFVIPVIVAFRNGTTYTFAFSVTGVGVVLYIVNIFLIQWFITKRTPELANDELWEHTAGTGVVPKWVSYLGLAGMAFIPSGLLVALLLALGLVVDRG